MNVGRSSLHSSLHFFVAAFYCSYDPLFMFRLHIRIFKLMTSHEHVFFSGDTRRRTVHAYTHTQRIVDFYS
jgi:hypothetical protein